MLPLLRAKGYRIVALDLPGFGEDKTDVQSVTLSDCVSKVMAEAHALEGSVVLLGHSSGGVVISQAAELLGREKVGALIFLDAFLPENGDSVFSLSARYAPEGAPLGQCLVVSTDHTTVSLPLDKAANLLYHDCSEYDVNYATSRLRTSPLSVLATPVELTRENYGVLRKYYIHCTEARDMDKAGMSRHVQCERVITIPSSHSPFFSMPVTLTATLDSIVAAP